MRKYYDAVSLNGNRLAIVTDFDLKESNYKSLKEVEDVECERVGRESELVINVCGVVSRHVWNEAQGVFDMNYCSEGTKCGANDWGFVR